MEPAANSTGIGGNETSSALKKLNQENAVQQQQEQSCYGRRTFIICILMLTMCLLISLSISLPLLLAKNSKKFTVSDACRSTRYPQVCLTSLASSRSAKDGPKQMLEEATKAARDGVSEVLDFTIKNKKMEGHNVNVKAALRDCMDLLGSSIEELDASVDQIVNLDINMYKSQISDIQTWMSAALTYHETCMDELEDVHQRAGSDIIVRLENKGEAAQKLLSNALALIDPLQTWMGQQRPIIRHFLLVGKDHNHGWRMDEREMLGERRPSFDAIVAQDGSGHFFRIQDAINAAPRMSRSRFVIHIKAGIYHENVDVKIYKPNIVLVGDGQGKTIITGNKSIMQPGVTTRTSATVGVDGRGFMARDLTIENTAGPFAQQAVALRVGADQTAFWRCSIHGHQDTLLAHVFRQFYRDCTVTGTVDFVFGNAAAVFQNCTFLSRVPIHGQQTVVTAQGRTDPAQSTGFAFHMCTVGGEYPVYLGRPWREYARVVWMRTKMGRMVEPKGWLSWQGSPVGMWTSYFAEYLNWGPGGGVRRRVRWCKIIRRSRVARMFTPVNFIAAKSWIPSTSIVFNEKL